MGWYEEGPSVGGALADVPGAASRWCREGRRCASHADDGAALLPVAKYYKNRRYEVRNADGEKADKSCGGHVGRGHVFQLRHELPKSQDGWARKNVLRPKNRDTSPVTERLGPLRNGRQRSILLAMAINIKSADAERLVRELADLTGESITDAIHHAVRERLTREKLRKLGSVERSWSRIERIQERIRSFPPVAGQTAQESTP